MVTCCRPIGPRPPSAPRGHLVVLQEFFGLNDHIRSVADRFAALGIRCHRSGVVRSRRAGRRVRLRRRRYSGGPRLACPGFPSRTVSSTRRLRSMPSSHSARSASSAIAGGLAGALFGDTPVRSDLRRRLLRQRDRRLARMRVRRCRPCRISATSTPASRSATHSRGSVGHGRTIDPCLSGPTRVQLRRAFQLSAGVGPDRLGRRSSSSGNTSGSAPRR